jgi:hypothetical protein
VPPIAAHGPSKPPYGQVLGCNAGGTGSCCPPVAGAVHEVGSRAPLLSFPSPRARYARQDRLAYHADPAATETSSPAADTPA